MLKCERPLFPLLLLVAPIVASCGSSASVSGDSSGDAGHDAASSDVAVGETGFTADVGTVDGAEQGDSASPDGTSSTDATSGTDANADAKATMDAASNDAQSDASSCASNIVAFTAPGYSKEENWSPASDNGKTGVGTKGYAACLQTVNQILKDVPQTTHVAIQTQYQIVGPNSWSGNTVSTSAALSDAAVTNMILAIKSAGLRVILKPHIAMADGTTQTLWLPGAKWAFTSDPYTDGTKSDGTFNSNSTAVSSNHVHFVAGVESAGGDVGKRIVSPYYANVTDIPGSGYTNFGKTAPTFTTIVSVQSATSATMSAKPPVSAGASTMAVLWDDDANPSTAPSWNQAIPFFPAWLTILKHLSSLVVSAGATLDIVNASTEHDWCTRYYPEAWAWVLTNFKVAYPGVRVLVQTAEGLDYQDDVPEVLQSVCDFGSLSAYPTVGTAAGGDPQATVNANWATAVAPMAAWSAVIGKPLFWGEVGARSIKGASYHPSATGFAQGVSPATDQAAFVEGMYSACAGQPWFAGFDWYTWYFIYPDGTAQGPSNTAGTMDYVEGGGSGVNGTYAPKEAAQAVFASHPCK